MHTDLLKSVRRIERRLNEMEAKQNPPSFGSIVRGLAALRGFALNKETATQDVENVKALTTGSNPGAILVSTEQQSEVFTLLSIGGVLYRSGATVVPMGNVRKMNAPAETAAATVEFIDQNVAQSPADPSYAQVSLSLKSMRSLFKIGAQVARASVPTFDRLVKGIAARSIARASDRAFFQGMAGGSTSLLSIAGTFSVSQSGANLAYADLTGLLAAAIAQEIDFERAAFYVNGATFKLISNLKDTTGHPILKPYRDENGTGYTCLGLPLFVTNTIPATFGSGSASYVLLTVPENIVVGSGGLEVSLSEHFALEQDAITVRVLNPFDAVLAQPAGALILTGVV